MSSPLEPLDLVPSGSNPVISDSSTASAATASASASAATASAAATAAAQEKKKKRVIIGLPGDRFSQAFLLSWTETLVALLNSGRYDVIVSPGKSSFVSFARMQTLGLDVLRGKGQKPFNGSEYDVFVSIDSDIVFSPVQLIELIECVEIHPVVSGYYMMANNKHYAVVKEWNKSHFAEHGTFSFLEPKDLEGDLKACAAELEERKRATEAKEELKPLSAPKFIKVSYAGLGFFACRKEVLDELSYPYFNRELQRIRGKDGVELVDMCSEDVAFCKNIEDAGYDVMLNTRLRVGHEKSVVL